MNWLRVGAAAFKYLSLKGMKMTQPERNQSDVYYTVYTKVTWLRKIITLKWYTSGQDSAQGCSTLPPSISPVPFTHWPSFPPMDTWSTMTLIMFPCTMRGPQRPVNLNMPQGTWAMPVSSTTTGYKTKPNSHQLIYTGNIVTFASPPKHSINKFRMSEKRENISDLSYLHWLSDRF